jgi:hypothetical protein
MHMTAGMRAGVGDQVLGLVKKDRLLNHSASDGHPNAEVNAIPLVHLQDGKLQQMNWEKLLLLGGDRVQSNFGTLVDRKVRDQRRNERRLTEYRMTKHQIEARKSCVADARSYRVASHGFKRWLAAM